MWLRQASDKQILPPSGQDSGGGEHEGPGQHAGLFGDDSDRGETSPAPPAANGAPSVPQTASALQQNQVGQRPTSNLVTNTDRYADLAPVTHPRASSVASNCSLIAQGPAAISANGTRVAGGGGAAEP